MIKQPVDEQLVDKVTTIATVWNAFLRSKLYTVQCTLLYFENDAEIFPVHYAWKVVEKGFKMAFMMNSCEIILEK